MVSSLTPNIRRALRIGAGVTLAELSATVGVAETTCFYWERGATPRAVAHRGAYEAMLREWAARLTSDLERAAL
jgi:hypothetical protein